MFTHYRANQRTISGFASTRNASPGPCVSGTAEIVSRSQAGLRVRSWHSANRNRCVSESMRRSMNVTPSLSKCAPFSPAAYTLPRSVTREPRYRFQSTDRSAVRITGGGEAVSGLTVDDCGTETGAGALAGRDFSMATVTAIKLTVVNATVPIASFTMMPVPARNLIRVASSRESGDARSR
jgi:hypothetical protein